MSFSSFSNIPSWLLQPSKLHNVFNNQFASLKDISSCTSISNTTSFSAGLRQALYWRKRLSPSTSTSTVIFSLLGPQGLTLPNVPEICQALKGLCNILSITEIYRASNSHFIGFTFSSPSTAAVFRSSFTYFHDLVVIHVPLLAPQSHHFKLSWLPPVFPDSRIHHFLRKHSISHSFKRDIITTGPDSQLPTNSVTGTLQLAPDADINSIPHLIPLPPPHIGHAFLIISGRHSYCLRCDQVGHVRRSCNSPRCSSCHHFHATSSPCTTIAAVPSLSTFDFSAFEDFTSSDISTLPSQITISPPSPIHIDEVIDSTPLITTTLISAFPKCDLISDASLPNPPLNLLPAPQTIADATESMIVETNNKTNTHILFTTDDSSHAPPVVTAIDHHPSTSFFTLHSKTTSSKPAKKRAKTSTLDPISSASLLPKHASLISSPSWAEQVEEVLPLIVQVSHQANNNEPHPPNLPAISIFGPALTSNISSTEGSSMPAVLPDIPASPDQDYLDSPETLLLIAAQYTIASQIPIPPHLFIPTPNASESYCSISCSHCSTYTSSTWPPKTFLTCSYCSRPLIISMCNKLIPDPSSNFVALILSPDDHTDPICISYLLYCLRFRVPLFPCYAH